MKGTDGVLPAAIPARAGQGRVLVAVGLAMALALGLAGCGAAGSPDETPTATGEPASTLPPSPTPDPIATLRPYTDDSPWNQPIGPDPIYDPYSDEMVATLRDTVTDGRIGSDTTQYTYTVYFADSLTPRHNIPCLVYSCSVVIDGETTRVPVLEGFPIPDGARPSSGSDGQLIVIDTETGEEFGLWRAVLTEDGWQAANGYRYSIYYDGTAAKFASRGAGVPYYAGLVRPWEIRAGEITHAIAFGYDYPAEDRCVYPASKTDGVGGSPYAIPEGARLQLNPDLGEDDFDRWGLSRAGRIVARALQVYGMIVIDNSGSPKIYAENLIDNPLTTLSWDDPDLEYTKDVIRNVPYDEFRVLALPAAYWDPDAPVETFGECLREPSDP